MIFTALKIVAYCMLLKACLHSFEDLVIKMVQKICNHFSSSALIMKKIGCQLLANEWTLM